MFVILAGRLLYLQHIRYEYYAQYAQENQLQRERIIAPRGLIKDRNGVVLVDNVPRFDIVMPWRGEEDIRRTVDHLNHFLPIDTTNVYERFKVWRKRNTGIPFPVVRNADKLVISFVRENYDRFPKLRVETNARRRYREGAVAAHLLGYVGEVNDEFLLRSSHRGYVSGDLVGKTGIEGVCESFLRGKDGQRVVAVNAAGTKLGEFNELLEPPVPGKDVTLTIDGKLQRLLEDLVRARGSGAAVVMNVEDGSILAAVSLPGFDPNSFAIGIKQAEWNALNQAEEKPLFNRFLTATYPPASTLKIVSMYAVLSNRLVPPGEALVYCTGAHRFGNRIFKCWKAWGHGYMDLHSGLVQSCDSYFYKVAERMDVDMLASACEEFGLGTRTGIDLPNEIQGLVPDRKYYDRRYGKGKWTQGLVLNNIIGQGEFLVSVLQMCRAVSAIANGGYLVRPHVVREIGGEFHGVYPRRKIRKLTGPIQNRIRRAMRDVVQSQDGTAKSSRVAALKAAGKTGTAQNPHGDDHAWFIGYAPEEDPEIAIAIIVENAGHGGSVAGPIVRKFYEEYFKEPESVEAAGPTATAVATPVAREDQ